MSYKFKSRIISWGCVQYINALPFRLKTLYENNSELNTILDTPKNLVNSFLKNELDVVLTSSICHRLTESPYIPGLGIAASEAILSVNLYAKDTFFSPQKKAIIGVIQESVSSITLIRVLAQFYWKIPLTCESIKPQKIKETSYYDAFLLIGDSALQNPTIPGYKTYDLAHEWYKFTKLPFVFALFLVKNNFSLKEFRKILEDSLTFSRENESLLIQTARQFLPKCSDVVLKTYYKLCIYKLGINEMKGFDTFLEFYEQLSEN